MHFFSKARCLLFLLAATRNAAKTVAATTTTMCRKSSKLRCQNILTIKNAGFFLHFIFLLFECLVCPKLSIMNERYESLATTTDTPYLFIQLFIKSEYFNLFNNLIILSTVQFAAHCHIHSRLHRSKMRTLCILVVTIFLVVSLVTIRSSML